MAAPVLEAAPILSTPDTHIFQDPKPAVDTSARPHLSDEQLTVTYEVTRTVRELRQGRWKRIALQFPDHMLSDAPRVYEQLSQGLTSARNGRNGEDELSTTLQATTIQDSEELEEKLFILGDTSYGACCVDEVAAEHVDADVMVHYGRSCLSPPSRLPVIHVFTERPLDMETAISTFIDTYPNKEAKIVLMADIPYSHHIPILQSRLVAKGYTSIFATELVHSPSSLLPNRTVPSETEGEKDALREYALFHISDPPTSLLLTLSSRVASIHIYPTTSTSSQSSSSSPKVSLASTAQLLRRRYALLTSLSTNPVFGILINTLSVKNYMHILSHVQSQITAAGKKHYTFVVGKVNAAKVANFSEVGGWVVIGCWESSLMESKEFWKPMITPWELGISLMSDEQRVWTGAWEADYQAVLDGIKGVESPGEGEHTNRTKQRISTAKDNRQESIDTTDQGDYDSEPESAPPEFDLRTGRYVSHSRPMRSAPLPTTTIKETSLQSDTSHVNQSSTALTKRANGDIAAVGGVASPGAEYLRSQRTWQGLGSDFRDEEQREEGHGDTSASASANRRAAKMEQGRSGIARGYVVGDEVEKH